MRTKAHVILFVVGFSLSWLTPVQAQDFNLEKMTEEEIFTHAKEACDMVRIPTHIFGHDTTIWPGNFGPAAVTANNEFARTLAFLIKRNKGKVPDWIRPLGEAIIDNSEDNRCDAAGLEGRTIRARALAEKEKQKREKR